MVETGELAAHGAQGPPTMNSKVGGALQQRAEPRQVPCTAPGPLRPQEDFPD